jgi:membrane protein implicated in regulation of membrane protease activity
MNSNKGFRKAKGDFPRAAAGAAVLIVTAISTAALLATDATGSGAPSASSSQKATAGASVSLAGLALTVGGVLVALIVVMLTVVYGRRRIARRRAGGRRGGTHAKESGSRANGAIKSVTEAREYLRKPQEPVPMPKIALDTKT